MSSYLDYFGGAVLVLVFAMLSASIRFARAWRFGWLPAIVAIVLGAWAGIVTLAWRLADARMAACRYSEGYTCELRVLTVRDNILVGGLIVGALLVIAFAATAVRQRRDGPASTNPAPTRPARQGWQRLR